MRESDSDREGFAAFLLRMRAHGINDTALLSAMESTPRLHFTPGEWHRWAWSGRSIPIECGENLEGCDLQARALAALEIAPGHRVLEIGTGSGYTAAVMAKIAGRVSTLDRYRTLVEEATTRYQSLGLKNVVARQFDGMAGPDDGPYDRIIIWAAFEENPRHFAEHLTSGGIMVAPVGPAEDVQVMYKFAKTGSRFERTEIGPVRLMSLMPGLAQAL